MRCFRSKLGHSNEKVYLKLIDRRLKMLLKEGLHSFLRPTTSELRQFFRTSLAGFLIKGKHKYKTLKHFLSKKHNEKAPAISKSTKKTAIQWLKICHNIAQNFKYVQNENVDLYIRQIYFTDQNCVISSSWKIAKGSR